MFFLYFFFFFCDVSSGVLTSEETDGVRVKHLMSPNFLRINISGNLKFPSSHSTYPESSHLDASPPPAEGLGAHVGGHKVAVAHPPRSAEEVGQAVGDAGGGVAGSLLCCNAASEEQTGVNAQPATAAPQPHYLNGHNGLKHRRSVMFLTWKLDSSFTDI